MSVNAHPDEPGSPSPQEATGDIRLGLARTLFTWFLLLSLMPLIIVGAVEYNNARDNIVESRHEELSTVNLMLSRQIGDYFDAVIINMHFRSGKAVEYLTELKALENKQGATVREMQTTPDYYELTDNYAIEFIDLLRFYNYSDVLIGDVNGNIVYSVGRYSDFGENLFKGELSETLFSKTVREALDNDDRLFSDQEFYPTSGDQKVSFFVLPLIDDNENMMGFLAAQIWEKDDISFILSQSLGLSDHVEAYVVGQDRKMRFLADVEAFQDTTVTHSLVEEWMTHLSEEGGYIEDLHEGDDEHSDWHASEGKDLHVSEHGDEHDEGLDPSAATRSHIMVYHNASGEKVMGVSRNIEVAGTNMLVISEMNYDTAMAPAIAFRNQLLVVLGFTSLIVLVIAGVTTRRIVNPIRMITLWVNQVAAGNYVDGKVLKQNNEIGELSRSFQVMTERLRKISADNDIRSWHQNGVASLNETVRGEQAMAELCRNIITTLCRYLDIPMGAMYVVADARRLQMMGSFALSMRKKISSAFSLGEGLPGQAALEKKAITVLVPDDYFAIESGLGAVTPDRVFVLPVIYEGQVQAVLELALLGALSEQKKDFLEAAMESIAVAINTSLARDRVQELLDKTTLQAHTLQQQQEDLRTANEELEHQTNTLKESEEELKSQSDELQRANVELEEKSESLFHQKEEIQFKNEEIERARLSVEKKAEELEVVSKYKSEFLANMSHELRTPLNSMLILAKMLADNDEGNLDEDQMESAQVIHKVGHDLLNLINDILDLSKVEAGKMELNIESVSLEGMLGQMRNQFFPQARERGLAFDIAYNTSANVSLDTDAQRVMQVLKNLLSNAFKFTEKGGVKVTVGKLPVSDDFAKDELRQHGAISIAVTDSGIGIPEEKQKAIFSAFQQADGSTSRKYGGTGLGLSIAREMTSLLGGEMRLESHAGKGSTFTLLLPAKNLVAPEDASEEEAVCETAAKASPPATALMTGNLSFDDDRDNLGNSPPILVVEDDPEFSRVLYRLAKAQGCSCLVTGSGKEAIAMVAQHTPQAVILDLGLVDMDGSEVLQTLQEKSETENIPVHIISGRDMDSSLLEQGAADYLRKPVSSEQLEALFSSFEAGTAGSVLVVDPSSETSELVTSALAGRKSVLSAATAEEASKTLEDESVSHIILELDLPDMSGDALLETLKDKYGDELPPVIINTAEDIDEERYKRLGALSGTMVVKGEKASQERLQDEVALFLNSVAKPSAKRNKPAAKPQAGDAVLKGRKILLVDDDLRNTFALSKALQKYELDIVLADNGELALEQLDEDPNGIELVLMDIMMPVMDGYEATQRIREQERFQSLPVIALTAKAMVEDRDKCIAAGASDYLTKPVEIDKLVAMMRVWLQNDGSADS